MGARIQLSKTEAIFVTQIATGLMSLLATIGIARYAGAEIFGFYSSSILLLSVGLDLVDFGACSWGARSLINGSINVHDYLSIMKMKTRLALAFLGFSPLILFLCPNRNIYSVLFLLYPSLWLQTNYIQQYLISNSRVRNALILQIVERASWLLVYPFILLGLDSVFVCIAPVIIGLCIHCYLGNKIMPPKFSSDSKFAPLSVYRVFKTSKHFGQTSVLTDVINLDAPLIAKLSSLSESASYNLAQRFRNPLQLPYQSFSTRLKIVSYSRNKKNIYEFLVQDCRLLVLGTCGILLTSVFMYLYSELIFGNTYIKLGQIMAIVIITAIPSGISSIVTAFLTAIGNDREAAFMTFLLILSTLIGIIPATQLFGVYGAVWFILLGNVILATGNIILGITKFKKL